MGPAGESIWREMVIGRWSEERDMWVDHLACKDKWLLAKEMSGDEGMPDARRAHSYNLLYQKST